tara:strand:+ start:210 stop:377 length:168 start_codon:yes stop_codon:yes gene_type:complete
VTHLPSQLPVSEIKNGRLGISICERMKYLILSSLKEFFERKKEDNYNSYLAIVLL